MHIDDLLPLFHVTAGHVLLDPVMVALTVLLPAFVLVAAGWDWANGRRREAGIVVLAATISVVVAVLLQFATLRPRPEMVRAVMTAPAFPSFPSGHAAIAAAVAVLLSLRQHRWAPALILLALAVGVSRVYLAHHFPSDVVVGYAIGGAIGAYAYGTFHADATVRPRWTWWLFPLASVMIVATANAYLGMYRMKTVMAYSGDKPIHFILFGGASFFLVAFFTQLRAKWIIAVLSVLTIAEELSQALSPMRSFDLLDMTCSLAGVLVCGWVAARYFRASVEVRGELGTGQDVVEVSRDGALA